MRARSLLFAVAVALGALGMPAEAGTFQISPTRLDLAARGSSAIFTLTNNGVETVRLQAKTFSWEQSPAGDQVLGATQDLVVFPTLFSLAPGETRKVKVGITTAPSARERSFRLIVEELPGSSATPFSGLRVLTRMSVPIFQAPQREIRTGDISQAELRGDLLAFDVHNRGTVRVMLKSAKVTCRDRSGEVVWEGEADGWYLLAGGKRAFQLQVPAGKAGRIARIEVDAVTDKDTWQRQTMIEGD